MTTLLGEPFEFCLYGKIIEGFQVDRAKLSEGLRRALDRQHAQGPVYLAYIYGYRTSNAPQRLPRPTIFIVAGPGEEVPDALAATYGEGKMRLWRLSPADEAARFDLEIGPIEALVDLDLAVAELDHQPAGATLMRGADGRLYCIPADLAAFEVQNEDDKSVLELTDGAEIGTMRVKTLTSRSALAVRSAMTTRSALTARSALTVRSALTARSALTLRSALTAVPHQRRGDE